MAHLLGLDWLRPLSRNRAVRWASYAVIGLSGFVVVALGLVQLARAEGRRFVRGFAARGGKA